MLEVFFIKTNHISKNYIPKEAETKKSRACLSCHFMVFEFKRFSDSIILTQLSYFSTLFKYYKIDLIVGNLLTLRSRKREGMKFN